MPTQIPFYKLAIQYTNLGPLGSKIATLIVLGLLRSCGIDLRQSTLRAVCLLLVSDLSLAIVHSDRQWAAQQLFVLDETLVSHIVGYY